MRSRLAEELKEAQRARFARMTPEERLAMSDLLAEQGIAELMSATGVDRAGARAMIRRSRRTGRKPSACLDERR